jgi:hypothetical protein
MNVPITPERSAHGATWYTAWVVNTLTPLLGVVRGELGEEARRHLAPWYRIHAARVGEDAEAVRIRHRGGAAWRLIFH